MSCETRTVAPWERAALYWQHLAERDALAALQNENEGQLQLQLAQAAQPGGPVGEQRIAELRRQLGCALQELARQQRITAENRSRRAALMREQKTQNPTQP